MKRLVDTYHPETIVSGKRTIRDGSRFNPYFPPPDERDRVIIQDGEVTDTVELMEKVVWKYLDDTKRIAPLLQRSSTIDTCKAIWEFIYKFIQYRLDKRGLEQLRRPARSWAERNEGVDCDCMSIFASSILTNLQIPHSFRITRYSADTWQHVYVIVPLEDSQRYCVIDAVVSKFNDEKLNKKLTRFDLLSNEFKNGLNDKAISYAILSWGGMNREHGRSLFAYSEWLSLVGEIRDLKVSNREEAFEKFYVLKKEHKLPGMGPAYFTKLICFLNPKLNGYIMDQWTAKSVNVICGKEIVKLTSQGFVDSFKNDVSVYRAFCQVIDQIAEEMKMKGIDVEESMFSNGGKNKGGWRRFLIENWHLKNSSRVQIRLNDEFDIVSYNEVIEMTKGKSIRISTLASKSEFVIEVDDELIVVTLSSGKKIKISESVWSLVLARIQELPQAERLMSSRYVDGEFVFNWKGCPNRVVCPYVPAIMRHFNL